MLTLLTSTPFGWSFRPLLFHLIFDSGYITLWGKGRTTNEGSVQWDMCVCVSFYSIHNLRHIDGGRYNWVLPEKRIGAGTHAREIFRFMGTLNKELCWSKTSQNFHVKTTRVVTTYKLLWWYNSRLLFVLDINSSCRSCHFLFARSPNNVWYPWLFWWAKLEQLKRNYNQRVEQNILDNQFSCPKCWVNTYTFKEFLLVIVWSGVNTTFILGGNLDFGLKGMSYEDSKKFIIYDLLGICQ